MRRTATRITRSSSIATISRWTSFRSIRQTLHRNFINGGWRRVVQERAVAAATAGDPSAGGPSAGDPSAGGPSAGDPSAAPTGAPTGAPTVFICHASEDREKARQVHDALRRARLEPWLDKESLRGGDRWDDLIGSTIEKVDYFVVLNSRALAAKSREASYVNKEIKRALLADERRLIGHFIVPASIDDTPLLAPLKGYQAVDLRPPEGLNNLVRAIKRKVGGA